MNILWILDVLAIDKLILQISLIVSSLLHLDTVVLCWVDAKLNW